MCELASLTPPVGMNLYVVQGAGQWTDVIGGDHHPRRGDHGFPEIVLRLPKAMAK